MDNSKIKFDDGDRERIKSNIELLKGQNIPYSEYMVVVPINALTEIRSKEEIIDKLLIDYVIFGTSSYGMTRSNHLIGELLDRLNKKYNIDMKLSIEDKRFVIDVINGLYSSTELEDFCYKLESVNVCLWSLGLVKKIDSLKKCDDDLVNRIMLSTRNYNELYSISEVRSKEEILREADLVSRYYWALREIENNEDLDRLDERLITERNETFEFITSYTYDSLSANNFEIEINKDDLKFDFEIPEDLKFEKITDNDKEILSLRNDDQTTKIVMLDLGKINIEEYQEKVKKYTNLYVKNGFELLGTYYHSSTMLKEKITHIVVSKSSYALNTYFIFVSNHLVRIDSLVNGYIDCKNYFENINSRNCRIDLDILFSINEAK